jgi:hypothetical protein
LASIHFTEIQKLLSGRSEQVELLDGPDNDGFFEIRFDEPGKSTGIVDPEFQNKVLAVDTPFGTATIVFDGEGQLRSIDVC